MKNTSVGILIACGVVCGSPLAEAAVIERTIFAGTAAGDGRVGRLAYDDGDPLLVNVPVEDISIIASYTAYRISSFDWFSPNFGRRFFYDGTLGPQGSFAVYFPEIDVISAISLGIDGAPNGPGSFYGPVGFEFYADGLFRSLGIGSSNVDGVWEEFEIEPIVTRFGTYRTVPGSVVPVPGGLLLIGSAVAALAGVGSLRRLQRGVMGVPPTPAPQ